MSDTTIRAIAHPTDFSPQGQLAFAHALRLAMLHRCPLDLLHVRDPDGPSELGKFPKVRALLQRWGMLLADASPADVLPATGVAVRKVDIRDDNAVDGLADYLWEHDIDLVVMATHGRTGVKRWIGGSVSDQVMREARVPALLLGPQAHGFVAPDSGEMALRHVLLPVADQPEPGQAHQALARLLAGTGAAIDYIKIDRSFVCNLAPDSPDLALCEGIVMMAHQLGLKVVAEGIETEAQRALLQAAGCDYGQGYLFSRPVPAEDFEVLLSPT